jgi:hypothetical protein
MLEAGSPIASVEVVPGGAAAFDRHRIDDDRHLPRPECGGERRVGLVGLAR